MKALISPNEVRNNLLRVAEVKSESFEVALPLYWIDCPDNITKDDYYYSVESNSFVRVTPEIIPTAEQNKQLAINLLRETDWTINPDIADPTKSNPYLSNQNDFITWRSGVQLCVSNPAAGDYPFPQRPEENWQSSS